MRIIHFLLLTGILALSCDKSAETPIQADAELLLGTWVNSEAFISSGGPQYWVDVDEGEIIAFTGNGTFNSDRFTECATGNFSIVGNELILDYSCTGFVPASANEAGLITFNLELYSSYFILTPSSGPVCIEGCRFKYRRED